MKNIFVNENTKIKKALEKLRQTGFKCMIVTNKNNQLLGTLSDGDIRKALLKKQSIFVNIKNYYNRKPKFLYQHEKDDFKFKNLSKNNDYGLIPIVNKNLVIKDILSKNNFLYKKKISSNIPVVIMAGGKGTRLRPFTNILPKPLIPINGKSVIDIIFDNFISYGLKKFYLSTNYKSSILETYFKETKRKVSYIKEKKPLGTAGALYNLRNQNKDFIITNCDTVIDINYNDFYKHHKKNKNDITLTVAPKEIKVPYGICKINQLDELIKIDEKPKTDYLISVGLYLINSKIFKMIPKNKFFDMNNLIDLANSKGFRVGIYRINKFSWKDTGNWTDLNKIKL